MGPWIAALGAANSTAFRPPQGVATGQTHTVFARTALNATRPVTCRSTQWTPAGLGFDDWHANRRTLHKVHKVSLANSVLYGMFATGTQGAEPDLVGYCGALPMTNDQSPGSLKELYVTRPSLPSVQEYHELLETIWTGSILTNRGPLLQQFEHKLADYLGVEHISVVANATLGLIVALLHVGAKEVITTPFSFVATANAIRLAGAKPVFADIDPVTLALDPVDVERRITPQTGAILGVHCYGLPCDLAAFDALGARHNIPVIYDAAHAFGVRTGNQSVLKSGTMSVLSFHATKVFHSAEGGAIVSHDAETKRAIDCLCNHGIVDETTVESVGFNAKMSEFHAALGLVQLRHVNAEVAARSIVAKRYADGFASVAGIRIVCPADNPDHNYYSYPILVDPDFPMSRDQLYAHLRTRGIVARRYFYPLISNLSAYRDLALATPERFPVAEAAAERVLCLPMFGGLEYDDQMRVIDAIVDIAR